MSYNVITLISAPTFRWPFTERVCFRRHNQWKPIFSTRIRKWIFKTTLNSVRKLLIDDTLQCVLHKADVDPHTIFRGKNICARKTNKTVFLVSTASEFKNIHRITVDGVTMYMDVQWQSESFYFRFSSWVLG